MTGYAPLLEHFHDRQGIADDMNLPHSEAELPHFDLPKSEAGAFYGQKLEVANIMAVPATHAKNIGHFEDKCDRSPERISVLTEAEKLIHGARNSDYGHPLDNHTATADLMSAYLRRKHGLSIALDAEDVCIFNVLQKVARLANTPGHRDSLVDIGGYVGCVEMIQDERARRG